MRERSIVDGVGQEFAGKRHIEVFPDDALVFYCNGNRYVVWGWTMAEDGTFRPGSSMAQYQVPVPSRFVRWVRFLFGVKP